jgi:hypothetical protein
MSVMISSGTPNRTSASASARHIARRVTPSVTAAITQKREWVINTGHDLGFPPLPGSRTSDHDADDDVDLPQLHRPGPLPAAVTRLAENTAGARARPDPVLGALLVQVAVSGTLGHEPVEDSAAKVSDDGYVGVRAGFAEELVEAVT